MMSHTGRSRLWRARAAVLLFALISAVILILSVSDGRYAFADTQPQVGPWAWGRNTDGQLGNSTNDINAHPNPVQVINLTDVVTVAGGGSHSLAIKSDGTAGDGTANDGTVWAWGNDGDGQLGDGGTNTNKNTPVQVIDTKGTTDTSDDGPLEDVVAVAGGNNHSLAIKSDGTVWAWGANNKGQLGNGESGSGVISDTPVQVEDSTGFLTGVVAVAGGTSYSLALKSDGTVWAWGNNDVGQLGNGESGSDVISDTPVQVEDSTGFFTGVVAVAAGTGGHHSLAIKSDGTGDGRADDGTVWAWGFNSSGQLGDGTPTNRSTPVPVSNLADATDVSGGNFHSIALESDGTVWAWGANNKGQLGNGVPGSSNVPVQVHGAGDVGFLTDVEDLSSGLNHNLAATSTHGTVLAWGCNDYGQLGNSSVPTDPASNCATFSRTPVQTIGLFAAADVAGGGSHSLTLASADNTDPTTTASATTADGTYTPGTWTNKDVTVNLTAADDAGGSGVKEIVYSATGAQPIASTNVAGNSTSTTINTEGETTITYFARDNAGNAEAEQIVTIKLDKSAPMVDSWAPTGAGVSRGANVSATFSDEMDQATLTASTIKLVNTASGKRVKNVMVSCDDPCQTATLDPFGTSTSLLAKNTKYKVTITTSAMNLAGLSLDQNTTKAGNQPKVWTFKTGSSA